MCGRRRRGAGGGGVAAAAAMAELQRLLSDFTERGFVVLPVLSPDEVLEARALLATHRDAHTERGARSWASPPGEPGEDVGELYGPNGEAGRWICRRPFEADASLDPLVHKLLTAQPLAELVRAIVGPDLCLRTVWAMWRMPVREPPPPPEERAEGSAWPSDSGIHYQMWHREEGGLCLPDHPLYVHSLQVKVELDDCDSTSHCISSVPESLAEKRGLPLTPAHDGGRRAARRHSRFGLEQRAAKPFSYWTNHEILPDAVDIRCRAGEAIVVRLPLTHHSPTHPAPPPPHPALLRHVPHSGTVDAGSLTIIIITPAR